MRIDFEKIKREINGEIEFFPVIDSTSLYLKRLVDAKEDFPRAVVASAQTNGQGRRGKSFYSPDQTGLYITFAFSSSEITCDDVTVRVSLAVARAIDKTFGCCCGVKWVNDIYLNDRKVAGILCQNVQSVYLIGIGINVEPPEKIPTELQSRMGSVVEKAADSDHQNLIINLYRALFSAFSENKDFILEEYRNRCVHLHKNVEIETDCKKVVGTCLGINPDFTLSVEIDGQVHAFSSGFMTLKI